MLYTLFTLFLNLKQALIVPFVDDGRYFKKKLLPNTMSSKIPGFTSGLKAPSASSQLPSLLKRRGNETTSAAATAATTAEKRARTTDDATSGKLILLQFLIIFFNHFCLFDSCCSKQADSLQISQQFGYHCCKTTSSNQSPFWSDNKAYSFNIQNW